MTAEAPTASQFLCSQHHPPHHFSVVDVTAGVRVAKRLGRKDEPVHYGARRLHHLPHHRHGHDAVHLLAVVGVDALFTLSPLR